jgi:hypothetical protein
MKRKNIKSKHKGVQILTRCFKVQRTFVALRLMLLRLAKLLVLIKEWGGRYGKFGVRGFNVQ